MIPVPEPLLQPPAIRADITGMGRVLIIDDEPDILRHSTRLLLEPFGHEVLEGSNGLSGVHMAQEQRPDVIVLDLMMPMMNGHEVLQILVGRPRHREDPGGRSSRRS